MSSAEYGLFQENTMHYYNAMFRYNVVRRYRSNYLRLGHGRCGIWN